MHPGFQRHFDACRNFNPPGDRTALRIAGDVVGWVAAPVAAALTWFAEIATEPEGLSLRDPAALPRIARDLSDRGFYRHRSEAFDVRAHPGGPALTTIDRGALPAFGIAAEGVHLNGLVRRDDGWHIWVAIRAADKLLDPGKCDHLVAGGISAGMTAWQTLIKEGAEEAGLPADLAARAVKTAEISYAMLRQEGLRRDTLYCYDLELPCNFVPQAMDGEVERFELWPMARAYDVVRDTDNFKFNVNLVLIDLFERLGMAV